MPSRLRPVEELGDARLMRQRRIGIRGVRRRLGRVLAAQPVDVKQLFGGLVIRFEHVVFDRPCRRDAVRMLDFIEVALAQPQEHPAIDLAVAADEIMQAGTKSPTVGTIPGLVGLISCVDEDSLAVPIFAFARQISRPVPEEVSVFRSAPDRSAMVAPPGPEPIITTS